MDPRKAIGTVLLLVLLVSAAGCDGSFFERPPEDQLTADNFYNTQSDIEQATGALYNETWFRWNDRATFLIGDARAGNLITTDGGYQQYVNFAVTQSNSYVEEAWRSLFTTIGQANQVIQGIRKNASSDIPEEVRRRGIAEARFMRGYAYTYLGQLWGAVPLITNTPALIENPNVRRNRLQDVFQFALNDFKFAAENLPEERPTGRVTAWSAKGMLARTYFTVATLNGSGGNISMDEAAQARSYAEDVIDNSPLSLREDFGDLFLFAEEETNNNTESLFSLQWTFSGSTYGVQNSLQSYLAPSSEVTGTAAGWGGGTGVQGWVIQLYADNDERRPETFMKDGDYYPSILEAEGGYTYEAPRGQGATSSGGVTNYKKYIIGTAADNDGQVSQQRTGMDTYMLRLPEIYFIYARTILGNQGSTSDPEALEYYNRVRERAGLATANSITRDDIFLEQWREFALEGQNWFQLDRLHNYDPSAAVDFIEMQNRGYMVYVNEDGEYVVEQGEDYAPLQFSEDVFSLPYPQSDVLQNDQLLDDPVEYDFSQQGGGAEGGEGGGS